MPTCYKHSENEKWSLQDNPNLHSTYQHSHPIYHKPHSPSLCNDSISCPSSKPCNPLTSSLSSLHPSRLLQTSSFVPTPNLGIHSQPPQLLSFPPTIARSTRSSNPPVLITMYIFQIVDQILTQRTIYTLHYDLTNLYLTNSAISLIDSQHDW